MAVRKMAGVVVAALTVGAVIFGAAPASAACHSFTVSVSPSSASEGAKATVTVERDGAVADSSVHVSTIDETAKAPSDYSKIDQQVSFTSGTSRTFAIPIANDSAPEGAETFRVHLSEPSGCTTSSYELGPDAKVTIKASDAATPTPAPLPQVTVPPRTSNPDPAANATATPAPTTSATPTPTTSPTFSPAFAQQDEEGDGNGAPVGAIVGIVLGVLAAGSGAALLWYRLRADGA